MEIIFLLLLLFFTTVLYIIPAVIGLFLIYTVVQFIIDKTSQYGEPNDFEDLDHDP